MRRLGGGQAQGVHMAGLDLHDEQHVQASEENRAGVEEVAGQQAIRLSVQETPARKCPRSAGPVRTAGILGTYRPGVRLAYSIWSGLACRLGPSLSQQSQSARTACTRRRHVPGGRRGAASHSTGLFFRGDQQPADAIGVRDDVMDGRDAGEPVVCRHERLGSCRVGRCSQDRVERAEAGSFLEQA
jgi:hypothetical protein